MFARYEHMHTTRHYVDLTADVNLLKRTRSIQNDSSGKSDQKLKTFCLSQEILVACYIHGRTQVHHVKIQH